jgi:hypothetical protein
MNANFGPSYPLRLQKVVNHAERFADLLSSRHASNEAAAIWLEGRVQEIEAYVANLANEWRFEQLGESEATGRLEAYLESLHLGYRLHFCEPSCCTDLADRTTRAISSLKDTAQWDTVEMLALPAQHDTPESPISPR